MKTFERKFALRRFLSLWLLLDAVSAHECDKSKCPGTLRYYEELKCKPIYQHPGDCCATAYNCSHLFERSSDKCYANGHEYNVNEILRNEDHVNPCDIGCHCGKDGTGIGRFYCAIVDCFPKEAKPGCYLRRKLDSCCAAEEICPESPEDRYKCEVDGKTYLDGERFFPNEDSNLLCQCMDGYEGKNVPLYCRRYSCGLEERHAFEIRQNCAPVYEMNQSPNKNCNSFFRCQNSNDTVIRAKNEGSGESDHLMCKFGDLKLRIGDELSEGVDDFRSQCAKCTCEVPPTLTCQRLSDEDCKIKYHHND